MQLAAEDINITSVYEFDFTSIIIQMSSLYSMPKAVHVKVQVYGHEAVKSW